MNYDKLNTIYTMYLSCLNLCDESYRYINKDYIAKIGGKYVEILRELFYAWFPEMERFREENPFERLLEIGAKENLKKYIGYWEKKLDSSTFDF